MERIIVCVKPVPDPKHWDKVSMDPETQTLKREGIPSIINPLDKHALEAALTLREVHGGEVILLSMAPPFADATLREGLAMGADRAVLLSDRVFAGSDTLATARILAAGCRWIGSFDLVLCGNLTVDGSTAQVCSQLGEFLDLPSVMHVVELSDEGGSKLLATQKIENGLCTLRVPLPAVLSVRKELNKPRYIPFTGILAAESKEIALLSNADLKINEGLVGLHGSPTQMAGLELKKFQRAGERLEGSVDEIVQALVERFYKLGVLS
ncbi:MAG: electron transfer flavoprotein subunit beta/FixA family protein [Deltaproteobacteria bacterium]|nr:electron transfer flavoprotein subunit beta/FixA family protein [Deltaproteobacteria bacterium]MBW1925444.1 electron transfer flavoprotein subunit beta/FixA family protein [Deltaproteobacteria bacterium]MBW1949798.1 electron transfer flavoprotein subunit beta/FixA family protein [Deltaproteobacteria bacterium]MBW2348167.1 electron transfer flavoprotein subunit beta/FixA family protein [Deltaproteobacteria bacterium]RLB38968.1 MAG: electron transfer flavoprotein subunit beta [Deltaproteobacte